ncbi:snoRNA-binding rRNA-processing protein, partial [Coemansia spiralis]
MPKATGAKKGRHDPLHMELRADGQVTTKGRTKYAEREERRLKKEGTGGVVDPKTSKRLVELAREQQEEVEAENGSDEAYGEFPEDSDGAGSESDEGAEYSEEEEEDYECDEELEGDDAATFEKFMPTAPRERQNLADIIMAKIKEHEAKEAAGSSGSKRSAAPGLDPKIVQVYTKIGELLKRYKSGPVPKAFKIIPSIRNWEEVMYLTRPDTWTPQATYQATRMFVSNM